MKIDNLYRARGRGSWYEMVSWCQTNLWPEIYDGCKPTWYPEYPFFYFENEEDCILFTLRWS